MGIELNDVVFDLTSGPPAISANPSGLARWDPGTGTLYISDGTLWNDVTRSGFNLTTGVPAGAGFTGESRYDATANILYIYDGSIWQPH